MATAAAPKALLAPPPPKKSPAAETLVRVAREHNVSPFKQMAHFLSARVKKLGLHPREYYDFELYASTHTADTRAEFVGAEGSRRLNSRLSPEGVHQHKDFICDKAMLTTFLRALGLAATETQAVVDNRRRFGDLPVLRSVEDIRSFVLNDARYPLFAKPAVGSLSVGSALIESVDTKAGVLNFATGETVDIDEFAGEILSDHGKSGFLFQSAVRQHPDLTALVGKALGTVRVVTVTEEADRPKVLYALWKIPSPNAMSDNFWQDGSMLAQIDLETGEILRCRKGTGLDTELVQAHPASGRPLVGFRIPNWNEVKALAERAHAVFPNSGVLGWDIGVSADGPMIVECNDSPFHTLYQLSTGEGILNKRFAPVFDRIAERQSKRLKAVKARK